jgi:hypothetical protein
MGVALKLRRAARDCVDAGKTPFLFAHPNERMLQVHLRVGHTPLARMQRYAKPLRLQTASGLINRASSPLFRAYGREALVRVADDVQVVAGGSIPADVEHVFDSTRERLGIAVVRDHRYLTWRFGANPEQGAEAVIIRARGVPTAYLTFVMSGNAALVKDWLAVDGTALEQVFAAFVREARRRCASSAALIALETHPDLPAIQRLGFRLRPDTSTAVTYAASGNPVKAEVGNPSRWYMTVGDRDV